MATPPRPPSAGPAPRRGERGGEPVWLVRLVLALFLVGFAAYLGRSLQLALRS